MSQETEATQNGNATEPAEAITAESIVASAEAGTETATTEVTASEPDREAAIPITILPTSDAHRPSQMRTVRNRDWYRDNLDWNQSSSTLAKQVGVTRQRIAQLRKELFPDGKVPPAPLNPQAPDPAPDFSDIDPSAAAPQPPPGQPGPAVAAASQVNYKQLAGLTFDMSTGLMCQVFGPEWQPRKGEGTQPDERVIMVDAIARYYESRQIPDLPPGYLLAFCVTMYALPRFNAPPTKAKMINIYVWTKDKLSKGLSLFKRKKAQPAPPTISIVEKKD